VSPVALVTTATETAETEAARWQQWRQHYADSSRRTTRHMQLLFAVALIAVVAFLARALLS
jgi:hypothetical protein